MKRLIYYTIFISVIACLTFSCTEESPEIRMIDGITVRLTYPAELFTSEIHPQGKVVRLKSNLREYTATSDAQGNAVFNGIMPDIYTLSSSSILSPEEVASMVHPPAAGIDVMANAASGGIRIFGQLDLPVTLDVGIGSSLLISKVYFTGCEYYNGKNIKYSNDQYIEFYNNSDQPVSTENLYFALLDTDSNNPFTDDKETYVYGKDIYAFPARMIVPGESIVLAREGRDHTQVAGFSIDLSTADYETKSNRTTTNPEVADMPWPYHMLPTLDYLSLLVKGGNAIILFKTEESISDWRLRPVKPERPAANLHVEIPVNTIIDAVETLGYKNPPDLLKKRLVNSLDASYVILTPEYSSANNAVSFDRKVIGITESGRKILKDTNNSQEDFVLLHNRLQIRDYEKEELYIDNPELLPQ